MQIETIGKYQLQLIAHELSDSGRWDPFFRILRFDADTGDFKCVLEKRRVPGDARVSYKEAIDAARRAGTALVKASEI